MRQGRSFRCPAAHDCVQARAASAAFGQLAGGLGMQTGSLMCSARACQTQRMSEGISGTRDLPHRSRRGSSKNSKPLASEHRGAHHSAAHRINTCMIAYYPEREIGQGPMATLHRMWLQDARIARYQQVSRIRAQICASCIRRMHDVSKSLGALHTY